MELVQQKVALSSFFSTILLRIRFDLAQETQPKAFRGETYNKENILLRPSRTQFDQLFISKSVPAVIVRFQADPCVYLVPSLRDCP